ncbi:MAG: SpoIIE family protein phosphatase [Calditrichaeota bacterium]|nr:SpoIIE family protein phosphatase [Calditrichota bacterium]
MFQFSRAKKIEVNGKLFFRILFIMILSGICTLYAQDDDLIFEHFNTSHGLSNNETHAVLQDSKGFLWIATQDGLNRFDGYNFKNYRNDPLDTTSIANNVSFPIHESKDGNLWIGTQKGLSLYNRTTDNFTNFAYQSIQNVPGSAEQWANVVLSIYEDDDGILWLGTIFKGLTRFDQQTWQFSHFLIDSNSTANVALWVTEDKFNKDLLWVGLNSGFTSFNKKTNTFGKPIEEDISKNGQTFSLYTDPDGTVWVGTEKGGLIKFDPKTEKYSKYQYSKANPNGIGPGPIWQVMQDPDNTEQYWICTQMGLYKLNIKTDKFIAYKSDINKSNTLSSDFIWDIYKDDSGVTWLATVAGLNKIDPGRVPFRQFTSHTGKTNTLSSNRVRSMTTSLTDKDILWIATEGGGLNKLNRSTNTFTYYKRKPGDNNSIGSDSVLYVYEDPDESGEILWVGTWPGGLNRFDIKNNRFKRYKFDLNNPNSISNNVVRNIYETRDGMLWLGTAQGVNRFDRKKEIFTRYQYQDTSYVPAIENILMGLVANRKPLSAILKVGEEADISQSFELTKKTQLLIISLGEGRPVDGMFDYGWLENADGKSIWKFDYKKSRHAGGGAKNRIQIWAGSLEPGQYKLKYISDTGHSYGNWNTEPPINQNMWGIQIFEIDEKENSLISQNMNKYEKPNSISSDNISSILEDSYGMLWIGTSDKGLNKLDRKTGLFTRYEHNPADPNSINNNNIFSLFEDGSGTLWVGTPGGLNKYEPKTDSFKEYTTKDGLPNNTILSMLEDLNGNIWLATNNGISKFDPGDESSIGHLTFINYNIPDGLPYNSYFVRSKHRAENGEMFFGGYDGMVSFFPGKINPQPPRTIISDFRIFNQSVKPGEDSPLQKSISETEDITLSYDQNMFSFEFVALHFSRPEKNQYLYKMDGFDKDWIDGSRRYAPYTNLDPGEYTFRVKASNSDGVWNEKGRKLSFIIKPPLWATWWAYSFYILFVFGLLYSARRFELNRQRKNSEIKESKLRAQAAEAQAKVIQAENERKTKELEEARALQLSMLPKELPQIRHLDIAVYMETATEVGGDYYDFHVALDGTLTVVIGDATGHGMKAGTMVTSAKSLFKTHAANSDILFSFREFSRCIKEMNFGRMSMCLTMLKIKDHNLQISSAAMPPAYIYRAESKEVEEYQFEAMPLGTMEKFPYEKRETKLNPGDIILLLSDGLPELENNNSEMYGYSRISRGFKNVAEQSAKEIISHFKDESAGWVNDAAPDDDVTFVVIKVK